MSHGYEPDEDADGWIIPACACGWRWGPCPDSETAADVYGDHRARAAADEIEASGGTTS